ncbi:hypothetical protein [Jeotgalibacillus sp. JSM ZJ347]|uniref:hypothetical protein n=1 Tax=Jeotgalibacillus sp. JSM ZJ347 TaxID=3342117 RepID=UPI0035A98F3E
MSIKQELEKSLPENLHFTAAEKEGVYNRIHKRKKRRFQVLPALAGAIALIMLAILVAPEMMPNRTAQDMTIEKVVVPDTPYPSLVRALYIDETSELVFSEENGLYAYHEESGTKEQLAELSSVTYEFAATEDWIVWTDPSEGDSILYMMNRTNQETMTLEGDYYFNLAIEGDTLVYHRGSEGYYRMNLETRESALLYELDKRISSSSLADVQGNFIVIPEESQGVTRLIVYDIQTLEKVNEIEVPYERVTQVQWSGKYIYGQGHNEDELPVLIQADRTTGEVQEIQTPGFDEFAVEGDSVALSVPDRDSDTIMLYEFDELKVRPLNTLDEIEERLVVPRFTDDGTLILNGEGDDRAMYIVKP